MKKIALLADGWKRLNRLAILNRRSHIQKAVDADFPFQSITGSLPGVTL